MYKMFVQIFLFLFLEILKHTHTRNIVICVQTLLECHHLYHLFCLISLLEERKVKCDLTRFSRVIIILGMITVTMMVQMISIENEVDAVEGHVQMR